MKIKRFFPLLIVFLFYLFSTIAYSAMYSTMNITGNAFARSGKGIKITSFKLATNASNGVSHYEEYTDKTISGKVQLFAFEDVKSVTYDIEITNYGNYDAGILTISGLPSGLSYQLIDYQLKNKLCDENGKCNNGATKKFQLKVTGSPGTYEFTLEFDFRKFHKITYTNIENQGYPTEVIDGGTLQITFKENLKRIQILSNNKEIAYYKQVSNNQTITQDNITSDIDIKIKEQVAILKHGSIDKIGSEVCIKDECFYIISNDGTKVSALSKYNLHVGNIYDGTVKLLENATGIQNEKAIGWFEGRSSLNPIIGSIAFTEYDNYYWASTTSNYPKYVYDNNSIIYNYLENYKTRLTNYNVKISNIRLIDVNELVELGCSTASKTCISSNYNWLYSTSYWTGSASSESNLWNVMSDGKLNDQWTMSDFSTGQDTIYLETAFSMLHGARPVIELSIDEIFVPVAKIVNGDINTIGSEICIENECFYITSTTNDTITMFAKYNLYVGYTCADHSNTQCTPYGDEATGLQNQTMQGWLGDSGRRDGVIEFSSTNYWTDGGNINSKYGSNFPAYVYDNNSTLYTHIENYKKYLQNVGLSINEARPIKKEELDALGCSYASNTCNTSAYSWLSTTTYWTGTASKTETLYFIYRGGGYFSDLHHDPRQVYGVRPIITIDKKNVR